jgi:hypothetical protein
MCPPQMEVHFEKLMWVFHFSKLLCLIFILVLSCDTWQVSRDKMIKKSCWCFTLQLKWGARHLQNKHPSTLGSSDLGRCLFWKSSHITLHITSSEFTYQGVYPHTYTKSTRVSIYWTLLGLSHSPTLIVTTYIPYLCTFILTYPT